LTPQETAQVAQALANGSLTLAALQAPPAEVVHAGDNSGVAVLGDSVLGNEQPSAEAQPATGLLPEAVIALWMPWIENGVAVAAGIVVLLLVAVGAVLARRREITDPPI